MSDLTLLGVAVLLLLLNAFFVGAEFAVISARRSAIEPKAYAGYRPAKIVISAMEQVSLMLATCQLGITLASLGLGAVAEPALAHLLEVPFAALGVPAGLVHPVAFALALAIVVYLHVVVGEMIPKNIALAGPDRVALWLAPPLVAVTKVLKPFVVALNWIANACLRAIRVQPRDEVASAFTRAEVQAMVDDAAEEGLLDDKEKALLAGALSFDEDTVAAVLIPLPDVTCVRLGQSRGEIEAIAAQAGYSRLPVLGGPGDAAGPTDAAAGRPAEFLGYVHLKDVITADPSALDEPLTRDAVRPLPAVAVDATLRTLLEAMQETQVHVAQVRRVGLGMDERPAGVDADRGELLGIVALEDVLGRLVGHIAAERR
ncbi:MAG: HlyC/CorC family transporter [Austwickia sp.]|jgi:CBS domain containing-hemolysin-like protein|nr:MAG: HlyC/CorC family transporter [Austwickia sp.]